MELDIVVIGLSILGGLAIGLPTKRFSTAAIISTVLVVTAIVVLRTSTRPEAKEMTTAVMLWCILVSGLIAMIGGAHKRSQRNKRRPK